MGLNLAGLTSPFTINQLSLHSTNPGQGVSPAAGTELTDSPYARKAATFGAPVLVSSVAQAALSADVVFDLNLTINQNVQFVGLWTDSVYKGYVVPTTPNNFTGVATTRNWTAEAGSCLIRTANPA